MESLGSVDQKVEYFNDCILTQLDYYLPTYSVFRHTADKPWVTDEFRRLIRRRQYAWTHGQLENYKKLRNMVNRLSKQLRQKFYKKRIQGLHNCNASNWWRQTKKLTGQTQKTELITLANQLTDGDLGVLAQRINESLQKVASDLSPLPSFVSVDDSSYQDKYVIHPYEVFYRLSRINIRDRIG